MAWFWVLALTFFDLQLNRGRLVWSARVAPPGVVDFDALSSGRMRLTVLLFLGVLLALALAASVVMMMALPDGGASGGDGAARGDALEQVEEPTEAFANALLDCSVAVRSGDATGLADCFADEIDGTLFPETPGPLNDEIKWISRHAWDLDAETSTVSRTSMLDSIDRFMAHFSAIEDVRFKVKSAEFVQPRRRSNRWVNLQRVKR